MDIVSGSSRQARCSSWKSWRPGTLSKSPSCLIAPACPGDRYFGRYIASGQGGENSDVIVWDFDKRTAVYRLSEHDHGVAVVEFSHDDRLLCSCGVAEDRKILIWDMSNGCIVAVAQHNPAPTTLVAWGGMVRYARPMLMTALAFFVRNRQPPGQRMRMRTGGHRKCRTGDHRKCRRQCTRQRVP